MTDDTTREQATCRGCGRKLEGDAYMYGGRAYVPAEPGKPRREAKKNWYGGFVCSHDCDYNSALFLEQSMPGHGYAQTRIGRDALRRVKENWPGDYR